MGARRTRTIVSDTHIACGPVPACFYAQARAAAQAESEAGRRAELLPQMAPQHACHTAHRLPAHPP